MSWLLRTYGRIQTAILSVLVACWVIGLILVPQAAMLDLSLWSKAPRGTLSLQIDRLYNDASTLDFDIRAERDGIRKAELVTKLTSLKAEITSLERNEKDPPKIYGFENYLRMSAIHAHIFAKTMLYSALVTMLAFVVCYPIACALALGSSPRRALVLGIALTIPYTMNELLRIYAWLMILDYQGVINSVLAWMGVVNLEKKSWIPFLEYSGSTFAALIYAYVLFMIFPIANTLQTLDRHQIEAAHDLGASTLRIHWRILLPHAKPGIAVGCVMTFMLCASSYSVPQIMSRGTGGDWFSQLIYRQFFEAHNWNIGSAYAVTLMLFCLMSIALFMALFRVRLGEALR